MKVHKLETCNDCRKIAFLIAESRSIRFNALLKLCQKTINSEYSAARLQRHLKGLKGQFIKRTRKGPQEVVYSLTLPIANLELGKLDLKQNIEQLREFPLKKLVEMSMNLYGLLAFEELIITMERLLKKGTPQEHSFRIMFRRAQLRDKFSQYEKAMANRQESEYIEALKSLKNEQDDLLRNWVS